MPLSAILLAIVSALVPVVLWYYILRRKGDKTMLPRFTFAFLIAGVGALLFLDAKEDAQNYLLTFTHSYFLIFLLFGAAIEYFKNFVVRFTGIRYFRNIDDVMDLSFAAALGFTFFENIYYLSFAFSGLNGEITGPVKMLKYFLLREFFILPVHLFCSGIFGYFYGLGLFSSEELREKNRTGTLYRLFRVLLFFIPEKGSYKAVKIAQGTFISVFFYGLFFTFLEHDPMVSGLLGTLGLPKIPVDEQLIPLIAFLFFKVGTIFLFSLMDRKRRWTTQKLLITK